MRIIRLPFKSKQKNTDLGGRSDLWIIPFGCAVPAMLVTWMISGFWPKRWSKGVKVELCEA
jgi:hypothetical protein